MIVDFHSHILPGTDDGAKNTGISLQMLHEAEKQGIGCITATPHFYAQFESPDSFFGRRNTAAEILRNNAGNLKIKVCLGAEVAYFYGISGSDIIPDLCIKGTKCILIEMPFDKWNGHVLKELDNIASEGFTPVVAHIERYGKKNIKYFYESRPQGVLVQSNGEAFLERGTRRLCMNLLKEGCIDLLGSDCHNTTSRSQNLKEACDVIRSTLKNDGERILDAINEKAYSLLENAYNIL